jgi:hypothetical protein
MLLQRQRTIFMASFFLFPLWPHRLRSEKQEFRYWQKRWSSSEPELRMVDGVNLIFHSHVGDHDGGKKTQLLSRYTGSINRHI